jgi:hypothetical protein
MTLLTKINLSHEVLIFWASFFFFFLLGKEILNYLPRLASVRKNLSTSMNKVAEDENYHLQYIWLQKKKRERTHVSKSYAK